LTDDELIAEAVAAGRVVRYGPGTSEDFFGPAQKSGWIAARNRARNVAISGRQRNSMSEAEGRQRAAAEAIAFLTR